MGGRAELRGLVEMELSLPAPTKRPVHLKEFPGPNVALRGGGRSRPHFNLTSRLRLHDEDHILPCVTAAASSPGHGEMLLASDEKERR